MSEREQAIEATEGIGPVVRRSDNPVRPIHGDIWRAPLVGGRFSVMMVCGHHDPPHVTGYWHDDETGQLDHERHGSIPLPRFLAVFELDEREQT